MERTEKNLNKTHVKDGYSAKMHLRLKDYIPIAARDDLDRNEEFININYEK